MNCPICGNTTKVVNTYTKEDCIIRRRECVVCRFKVVTSEKIKKP